MIKTWKVALPTRALWYSFTRNSGKTLKSQQHPMQTHSGNTAMPQNYQERCNKTIDLQRNAQNKSRLVLKDSWPGE